eukprot:7765576-Alexandrium_andersonii.AAC.1
MSEGRAGGRLQACSEGGAERCNPTAPTRSGSITCLIRYSSFYVKPAFNLPDDVRTDKTGGVHLAWSAFGS